MSRPSHSRSGSRGHSVDDCSAECVGAGGSISWRMAAACGSPLSAPPVSSPAHAADERDTDSARSTPAHWPAEGATTPEQTLVATAITPRVTTPTPTATAPKRPIQIPPSRAHKEQQREAAAAAAAAAGSSGTPVPSVVSPPRRRTKLHGSSRRFEADYVLLPDCVLGSGASGTVYVCTSRRHPTHEYAVKILKPELTDISSMGDELQILATVNHRNIIRLRDVYQNNETIHIVTELACGGELFDRILRVKSFSESDASGLARKLFHAVAYLHSRGIVHRDLKPENILFADSSPDSDIKISDFGFARDLLKPSRNLRAKTQLGTFGYMAPEIFSGKTYDERCDVWSLGVLIYILLSGLPPYVTLEDTQGREAPFWIYMNRINEHRATRPVTFPDDQGWKHVSSQAKHFLASVLEIDPTKRARSVDALNHPWLKRRHGKHAHVSGTMAPSSTSSHGSRGGSGSNSSVLRGGSRNPSSGGGGVPSAAASSSSVVVDASPSEESADHEFLPSTCTQLNRNLTFTLNKRFDPVASALVDDEGDSTADYADGPASPSGVTVSGNGAGDRLPSSPLFPQQSLTPVLGGLSAPASLLIRSASHDPAAVVEHEPSAIGDSPSSSRSRVVYTPSASRASLSVAGGGYGGYDGRGSVTAPPSANFTRQNSEDTSAALACLSLGTGMGQMSPITPSVAHPSALAGETNPGEMRFEHMSYGSSLGVPTASDSLSGGESGTSSAHSRDSSSVSSASTASFLARRARVPLTHYATLPALHSAEAPTDDEECAETDQHSSDEDEPEHEPHAPAAASTA